MPRPRPPSLLDLLTETGVHPDELAAALDLHRASVYDWLNGRYRPRRTRWRAIAEVLDVTVRDVAEAVDETERRALIGER